MSMHKTPLTELERKGLEAHGLDVGTPSQLSDCFRLGMKWALDTNQINIHPTSEEFLDTQWWYKELEKEANASGNLVFKRAVFGVIRNLIKQGSRRPSLDLSIQAIGDLAESAGYTLRSESLPDPDVMETEMTIMPMSKTEGVLNDNGVKEHYDFVAFFTEYPEEGSFPLGPKKEVKDATD